MLTKQEPDYTDIPKIIASQRKVGSTTALMVVQ